MPRNAGNPSAAARVSRVVHGRAAALCCLSALAVLAGAVVRAEDQDAPTPPPDAGPAPDAGLPPRVRRPPHGSGYRRSNLFDSLTVKERDQSHSNEQIGNYVDDVNSITLGRFDTGLQPGPGGGGSFDVSDSIMRLAGQNPYSYRDLVRLEATRAKRMAIAADERRRNLYAAIADTPARLRRIWASAQPAAQRRRLLFQLWDECAERGPQDVVAGAVAIRAIIVGFIRNQLPAGSRDAFRPAELEALNRARTSRARFQPYR